MAPPVRYKSKYPMIPVRDAIGIVIEQAAPLEPKRIPCHEAIGLVLAEDITSKVPCMSNS